ncbi:F-box protein At5g46170-like [Andrographis paniculata]|uniref:F-box protein At5g46170-like n=1 Tax=Andrographis paniculata TaxID=175694 RepID=UPI0021E971AA|nr:F-box protein At5g46170-like [Andrographis paniculata]
MNSMCPDLRGRLHPETIDYFDRLPDALVLSVFNRIGDVKALGRCCVVSRRFRSLVSQVEDVVVHVDCVVSDDAAPSTSSAAATDDSRNPFTAFFRIFFSGLSQPFQSLAQLIAPTAFHLSSLAKHLDDQNDVVTHHSPAQVLKNFNGIKFLRIELPGGELGVDDGTLLKWMANFGSTLDNCVVLGASSIIQNTIDGRDQSLEASNVITAGNGNEDFVNGLEDDGSIPESFYTNGDLRLRVVWTISSLIAASARHYLLQPIIAEHRMLDNLVLTDADGQGMLCMNREQLEELRVKPLSVSLVSNRTLVPDLSMRLWYAPHLELPNGVVLKGASLVAIRPKETVVTGLEGIGAASAFEEPFAAAAMMLVKRRTYCLEMNSF